MEGVTHDGTWRDWKRDTRRDSPERDEARVRQERERVSRERDTWLLRERERRTHTRDCARGGVCPLYRGTRMSWKGRGNRVTSCHSVLPSTRISKNFINQN